MDVRYLRRRVAHLIRRRGAPTVPPVPAGWESGIPDFVGVGTMKSGTTWWHQLIVEHPGVSTGQRKELHYFDRFCSVPFTEADRTAYAQYFPRSPGLLAGEWTPRYLVDFWTPALLRDAAPDAKLLVLLRDPVERYVSGITDDIARGLKANEMLALDHFARGLYHEQLVRLLHHFPREQVLVLQYERCCSDPAGELRRTYEFLGLEPSFVPPSVRQTINKTSGGKVAVDEGMVARLTSAYAPSMQLLADSFPEVDLGLWDSARAIQPNDTAVTSGQ